MTFHPRNERNSIKKNKVIKLQQHCRSQQITANKLLVGQRRQRQIEFQIYIFAHLAFSINLEISFDLMSSLLPVIVIVRDDDVKN